MSNRLDGSYPKILVITGSSRGLGLNIAKHYLEKNWIVYGCSRGESQISHANYHHESLNLSDEKSVRTWIKTTFKANGKIDALICNAGLVQSSLYLSITPTDLFQSFLDTNITGVFLPVRECSKYMTQKKSGRIILISSTMVAVKSPGTSIYSSTKSFTTQMLKVLAKEMANTNVTCNIIAPAMMDTSSSKELACNKEWTENMLNLQVFPRIIESEEICAAADFFLSTEARSITGQVINIGVVD